MTAEFAIGSTRVSAGATVTQPIFVPAGDQLSRGPRGGGLPFSSNSSLRSGDPFRGADTDGELRA